MSVYSSPIEPSTRTSRFPIPEHWYTQTSWRGTKVEVSTGMDSQEALDRLNTEETKAWLNEILAEADQGKRFISEKTQNAVKELIEGLGTKEYWDCGSLEYFRMDIEQLEAKDTRAWLKQTLAEVDQGKLAVSEQTRSLMKEMVRLLKDPKSSDLMDLRMDRFDIYGFKERIKSEEPWLPLYAKVETLERDAWLWRYGQYYAPYLQLIPCETRKRQWNVPNPACPPPPSGVDPEAWELFVTKPWSEIAKQLELEIQEDLDGNHVHVIYTLKKDPKAIILHQLSHLIHQFALESDFNYQTIISGIKTFRRATVHDWLENNELRIARNKLEDDLGDLRNAPAEFERDVKVLKQAIFETVDRYYKPGWRWSKRKGMLLHLRLKSEEELRKVHIRCICHENEAHEIEDILWEVGRRKLLY